MSKPDPLMEKKIEAGAQALVNDVWHPPIAITLLGHSEQNKFRRQATVVLLAARKVEDDERQT